jgi:hypothetical protein
MRTIAVSTDVFARIWALRLLGESTEDVILRRVLGVSQSARDPNAVEEPTTAGIFDVSNDVRFPEGFEIFRTYFGQEFRARANDGGWLLEDGSKFRSLNQLSRAIGARTENAWINWYFLDDDGHRRPVSDLRSQARVASRRRGTKKELIADRNELAIATSESDGTWRDDVRLALGLLGGRASLFRIYREVERLRRDAGRSMPLELEATVRRTLEDHSSDSANYRGKDLFFMPEGKGAGIWALREKREGGR